MQTFSIPINEVAKVKKRDAHYCTHPKDFEAYLSTLPSLDAFPKLIERREKFPLHIRQALHSVLTEQHHALNVDKAVTENINKLQLENTFAITTAHQPVIYGGPLYVLLKALSAISLSNELNRAHPEYNFVPIYWLGGEDDDFEEISHTYVYNKKVVWERSSGGSVGSMKLENIGASNASIQDILGNSEQGIKWGKVIDKCYGENRTLNEATRLFLYEMLATSGLVILDPDHPKLKTLLKPILLDEFENLSGQEYTLRNIESIKNSLGYKAQANPRAINFFLRSENKRSRIEPSQDKFEVDGQIYSLNDIKDLIESSPESFSPNVIYRPIYQELILPNLAYVGGGGELAYWTERKFLFDHLEMPFPMLVRRQSVAILKESQTKKAEKLGLTLFDLFKSEESALSKLTQSVIKSTFKGTTHREQMIELFNTVKKEVENIDNSLVQNVEAEKAKALKSLDAIESKIKRFTKRKEEDKFNALSSLFQKSFPSGNLGERRENILQHLLINHNLVSDLQNALPPSFPNKFLVMIS